MSKRTGFALALLVGLVGMQAPIYAKSKVAKPIVRSYAKKYNGSTDGLVIYTSNPARDFGNPADNSNPVHVVEDQVGYIGLPEVDPTIESIYAQLNGTPANKFLLRGTPADKNSLTGTPADTEVAGVAWMSFLGKPKSIKIVDDHAAETGLPVRWEAQQCTENAFPCHSDHVVRHYGCTKSGSSESLSGFVPGHRIALWIVTNDSPGLWGASLGDTCDSFATTGTATLITTT